jgi:hypothetical protein
LPERDARVQVARPLLIGCAVQPVTSVPPSLKATVPPVGEGETVALRVTGSPKTAGFCDEATLIAVAVAASAVPFPKSRHGDNPIKQENNHTGMFRRQITVGIRFMTVPFHKENRKQFTHCSRYKAACMCGKLLIFCRDFPGHGDKGISLLSLADSVFPVLRLPERHYHHKHASLTSFLDCKILDMLTDINTLPTHPLQQ